LLLRSKGTGRKRRGKGVYGMGPGSSEEGDEQEEGDEGMGKVGLQGGIGIKDFELLKVGQIHTQIITSWACAAFSV
jgi:hypothetical protein